MTLTLQKQRSIRSQVACFLSQVKKNQLIWIFVATLNSKSSARRSEGNLWRWGRAGEEHWKATASEECSQGEKYLHHHHPPTPAHTHTHIFPSSPHFLSVQFNSVAQSCLTLCDPMDCSMPGLPVHHQLLEFTQTHVHGVGDAIQSSHPLLSPSPPVLNLPQHQGLFKWVSSSHQVAKELEFQCQHQSYDRVYFACFV